MSDSRRSRVSLATAAVTGLLLIFNVSSAANSAGLQGATSPRVAVPAAYGRYDNHDGLSRDSRTQRPALDSSTTAAAIRAAPPPRPPTQAGTWTGQTTSTPRSKRPSGPGTAGEVRLPVRAAWASISSRTPSRRAAT